MNYKSVKEISKEWNIDETQVTYFCRNTKIPNCIKDGKSWLIPEDSKIPSSCRSIKTSGHPIPIGLSDFKEVVSSYYYIDKTLMIKDIIDTLPKVSLFTRPRRFGKTLNMDMLRVFFEKTDEDTSIYFKDKLIWSKGEKYTKYQGKYPVIFFTFKDVKFSSYENTFEKIKMIVQDEFLRHKEILEGDVLQSSEKNYFEKVVSGNVNEAEITSSLERLSRYLRKYYNEKVVIIVDEYDTPIQSGYLNNYYEEIVLLIRNLFSGVFKDNSNLAFGFLTGILRVAKESIFSGMNNLKENSILSNRFSEYFGFTENEIKRLLQDYGCSSKLSQIKEWYNGYIFGEREVYNPWSVLNYIDDNFEAKPYWQSTGNNEIIRQIVQNNSIEVRDGLERLMRGDKIIANINTNVVYPEINKNPECVFGFLALAGYLKVEKCVGSELEGLFCEVRIPNKEIESIYKNEVLDSLSEYGMQSTARIIQMSILSQDTEKLRDELKNYLLKSVSVYDASKETFYQGLMIGIYAVMNGIYKIKSNRESGMGRFDIMMTPRNIKKNTTGIIIEIKVLRSCDEKENVDNELIKLSKEALKQIDQKQYITELKEDGVQKILKYGIAFYKKNVEIDFCLENVE